MVFPDIIILEIVNAVCSLSSVQPSNQDQVNLSVNLSNTFILFWLFNTFLTFLLNFVAFLTTDQNLKNQLTKNQLTKITYQNRNELLNKGSELLCKCRHANKFLLKNYTGNDFR